MIFSEHARMVDINVGGSEIYGHFCDAIQEMLSTQHLTNNLFSPSYSSISLLWNLSYKKILQSRDVYFLFSLSADPSQPH